MDNRQQSWVVTCQNVYREAKNSFAGHRIPRAKTEAGAVHPDHLGRISVVCDECGKKFTYEASDVIMWLGTPASFAPHPLLS